jgi:hypothetical protein
MPTTTTEAAVKPARRRRRANASQGARPHRVVIKHSDEELATVKAMAAVQGISPPRLYVRALTTGDVEAAARLQRIRDELTATRRLLAAVSNNVNQIAVAANSTGQAGEDLIATLDAVRRVASRIEGVVRAVEEERR